MEPAAPWGQEQRGPERDQETHQLNKQMAHIKMDGSENVEKLYTKLTMKKAGKMKWVGAGKG